jgi:hypothetical protein
MTLTHGILSALTALLGIVREVLKRRNAPKNTATPQQAAEVAAHQARVDSAKGDAVAVNARLEQYRLHKGLGIAALAGMLLSGCCVHRDETVAQLDPVTVPSVVVISADRWQYPTTNSAGVSGWFVPSAVHADMMEAIELIEYYKTKEKTQ